MGNTLQFSLGLATVGFLSGLKNAQGAVSGLTGKLTAMPGIGMAVGGLLTSVGSLGAVVGNTFAQFGKGAELQALSRRTGESVAHLYQLQKGFAAARVEAGFVEPVLRSMQKALGGFNEMGEPTKDIFAGLGMDVAALKKLDAPGQLQAITAQLAKLGNEEATFAATKVFGRGMGGQVLQLARSPDFAVGMKDAEKMAAVYARNAEAFAKIEGGLTRVKGRFNSLFAGIAEGAAPAVQGVLDLLNKIDLSGVGQKIGNVISVATEALKEGKLGELLYLGLAAGAEKAGNFLAQHIAGEWAMLGEIFSNGDLWAGFLDTGLGAFAKLGVGLLKAFEMPLITIQASMEWVIQNMAEGLAGLLKRIPGFDQITKALGVQMVDFKAQGFDEILQGWKQTGPSFFGNSIADIERAASASLKSGIAGLRSEAPKVAEAYQRGFKGNANWFGTENQDALAALAGGLNARKPVGKAGEAAKAGMKLEGMAKEPLSKVEGSSLEKIGAMFFGGGRADYQREMAHGITELVREQRQANRFLLRLEPKMKLVNS